MGSAPAEKYSEDALPAYTPMPWSLKEIRAAIPGKFFVRDTLRGLLYFSRDVLMAAIAWSLATTIDPYFKHAATREIMTPVGAEVLRWAAWGVYWWFQGLIFTGIWVIGHECGHGAFSDHKIVNDVLGFITHTFLWTPYFSWKISHHRHHSNHASMERDEVYVPKTREDLNIPEEGDHEIDYDEILGDTPIYTLYMLIRQQVLAFPAYLLFNVSGQKTYPKWTNHFDRMTFLIPLTSLSLTKKIIANSILFTRAQRNAVILSNIGIAAMVWGVTYSSSVYGTAEVIKYYGIPWLEVTHWFIMITYLHHTDPDLPHYRGKEWNFQRGAAATVDRNFLGWQGRFFLHDVAHFHVIHHFFPKMPFYHGPKATEYLKAFIGDHYAYSDKNAFKALWDNYNKCQFVENDGDVLFYRDKKGQATRRPANEYRVATKFKSQ
ncbi:fatty acid desaturase-domain-containing protein [Infundibulicybe gibba]|nr:fatty acid desaturase-domain-containing protein [Infundibulicybe gibba]